MAIVYEGVSLMDVQVFKLNHEDIDLSQNEFLFLIRKRSPLSEEEDKEIFPDLYSFQFDPQCLSSRASMEELYIQAAESTEQFIDPRNVKKWAAVVSDYLADNFEFDLTAAAAEDVVIVVGLDRCFGFLASQVYPVILNAPIWVIDEYEDDKIVPWLMRTRGGLMHEEEDDMEGGGGGPIISRVPPLKELEGTGDLTGSCTICLENLTAAAEMNGRKMPCNHIFHGRCLARWMWRSASCPLCRFQLI